MEEVVCRFLWEYSYEMFWIFWNVAIAGIWGRWAHRTRAAMRTALKVDRYVPWVSTSHRATMGRKGVKSRHFNWTQNFNSSIAMLAATRQSPAPLPCASHSKIPGITESRAAGARLFLGAVIVSHISDKKHTSDWANCTCSETAIKGGTQLRFPQHRPTEINGPNLVMFMHVGGSTLSKSTPTHHSLKGDDQKRLCSNSSTVH